MKPLAELLGSSTRANIVEALSLGKEPVSAYQVAKAYNMNVAKVYIEMKRLGNLGLLSVTKGKRGVKYTLVDESLRTLALKFSNRVITLDSWRSPRARAKRFRDGLILVPKFSLGKPLDNKPLRSLDELNTLALLVKSQFEKKYSRTGDRNYDRV